MPYPTQLCACCGTPFTPLRRTTRTCSKQCRVKLNRDEQNAKVKAKRPPVYCEVCGVEMPGARSDRRSCSTECKRAIYRSAYIPQHERRARPICETCKRSFDAVRSDARFCSTRCQYASDPTISARRSAKSRAWVLANRDRRKATVRNYKDKRRVYERSGRVAPKDWERTVRRHSGRCAYCKVRPYEHMDHVVPLSRGGSHTIGNVLPACAACNLSKSNRFLVEWNQLRR